MNRFLPVWLLASIVSVVVANSTPPPPTLNYVYYPHVDMYYKFYKRPMTWFDAKQKCASEGAVLAMPRTSHEAEVIKQIFDEHPASTIEGTQLPDYVLLGFHDIFEEDEYVGLNGVPLQYFYHVWQPDKPDNQFDEDCGSMHRTGKLNDVKCKYEFVFICQMYGNTQTSLSNFGYKKCKTADSEYKYFEGSEKYYKLHTFPRKWSEARVVCDLECGNLAMITNIHEEQFLTNMFNLPEYQVNHVGSKAYALLGFHDMFREGNYFTVTDRSLDDFPYLNWGQGQPDNLSDEDCGSMTRTGELNDFNCGIPAVFFCERYMHKPYEYNSEVDLYYKFHTMPLKWYEARTTCANENATLAMPRNQKEADILKTMFDKYSNFSLSPLSRPDSLLLGFHDIFWETEFISVLDEPLQYYYHKWDENQPNNDNNQDCGSLNRNGKLNDISCDVASVFVCQKPGIKRTVPVANYKCLTNDPAYQHAGTYGIDKCYKLHMNPKTWTDARDICVSEGGQLAIVRSKAEEDHLIRLFTDPNNRVLYTYSPDYFLLGFHDLYREGRFVTVLDEDLTKIGYSNWGLNQPDNGELESCGSMHISGVLNDFPCYVPSVFICEHPTNTYDFRFLGGDNTRLFDYFKFIFQYEDF